MVNTYALTQRVRHWFGIHQRQRHYSISPRCDWCGHRSAKQKQKAIAHRNREAS